MLLDDIVNTSVSDEDNESFSSADSMDLDEVNEDELAQAIIGIESADDDVPDLTENESGQSEEIQTASGVNLCCNIF